MLMNGEKMFMNKRQVIVSIIVFGVFFTAVTLAPSCSVTVQMY